MNKLLLIIVIIETIALVFVLTKDVTLPTGFVVKEAIENHTLEEDNTSNLVFSTYTKAVCNKEEDFTVCNDRLFVKCGDMEYILPDVLNNSIRMNEDWKDPRGFE